MLKYVPGLLQHSKFMSVEVVVRSTSITSKSVSVPTATGTFSDPAIASAVEIDNQGGDSGRNLYTLCGDRHCCRT